MRTGMMKKKELKAWAAGGSDHGRQLADSCSFSGFLSMRNSQRRRLDVPYPLDKSDEELVQARLADSGRQRIS